MTAARIAWAGWSLLWAAAWTAAAVHAAPHRACTMPMIIVTGGGTCGQWGTAGSWWLAGGFAWLAVIAVVLSVLPVGRPHQPGAWPPGHPMAPPPPNWPV